MHQSAMLRPALHCTALHYNALHNAAMYFSVLKFNQKIRFPFMIKCYFFCSPSTFKCYSESDCTEGYFYAYLSFLQVDVKIAEVSEEKCRKKA